MELFRCTFNIAPLLVWILWRLSVPCTHSAALSCKFLPYAASVDSLFAIVLYCIIASAINISLSLRVLILVEMNI